MCDKISETDYNFELYKVLVDETRNLHTQWINNFRVILTFNSILMAGLIAIIVVFAKGEARGDFISLMRATLIILPILGISVTILGIRILYRLHESYELRYDELRFIEIDLSDRMPLLPYLEGNKKFRGEEVEVHENARPLSETSSIKLQKVNGYEAYRLIAIAFIAAYLFVSISQFSIKNVNSATKIDSFMKTSDSEILKTIDSIHSILLKSDITLKRLTDSIAQARIESIVGSVESINAQLNGLAKDVVDLKLTIEKTHKKVHNQANSADAKSRAAD